MLIGVIARAAQAPAPAPPVVVSELRAGPFPGFANPAAVIQHLMSFDVNADGHVSRDELPERMQKLMTDGDKNADASLDADEIRTLVSAASFQRTRVAFRFQHSEGLRGVISDLKLPQAKYRRALEIVGSQNPPRHVNDPAASALFAEMKALLDDEEYENFVAAATRLSRSADLRFRTVGGVVGGSIGGVVKVLPPPPPPPQPPRVRE
jgi:hypothetical protein